MLVNIIEVSAVQRVFRDTEREVNRKFMVLVVLAKHLSIPNLACAIDIYPRALQIKAFHWS
jgi:hypothetical protein